VQPGLETVRGAAQRLRKSRLPPRGLAGFVSPKCAAACVAVLEPSCAGLTRASIEKAILSNRWIAGSSPAMTGGDVNGALNPLGFVSPKCAASVIISSGSRPAPRDKKARGGLPPGPNSTSINTIDFTAGAPAYSFTVQNGATTFTINTGISNNPGFEPAFTVNAGAALTIGDGGFAEIGSLAGGGTVTIGPSSSSPVLSIVGPSSTTFSGTLAGAGTLELDNGTLTLTGLGSSIGGLNICNCDTNGLIISGGRLDLERRHRLSGRRRRHFRGPRDTHDFQWWCR
jgi:hypothetical protein